MRMQALISDIHGNLAALDAVMRDVETRSVDEVLCLGDIVGYGPDPEACLDVVMARARWALMGNHDHALLHGAEGFNPLAAEVIRLTADRMSAGVSATAAYCPHASPGQCPACLAMARAPAARWQYLEHLELSRREGDVLYVHGSPLDPVFEYVFPDRCGRAWRPGRARQVLDAVPGIAFCGHTHYPCAISSDLVCHYPVDGGSRIQLEKSCKYLVNLGSVGQPRDGDPRASYVLFDERERIVEWRRLPYDIASVAERIEAMCGRDNWCAKRLWKGR
jgi:diadenosine tetraphosphatase ApaH/serine/threonine PP2A family protein phosphatase